MNEKPGPDEKTGARAKLRVDLAVGNKARAQVSYSHRCHMLPYIGPEFVRWFLALDAKREDRPSSEGPTEQITHEPTDNQATGEGLPRWVERLLRRTSRENEFE